MSLTYQQAYDHLIKNVFAPVFFDKLAADYGFRPTSEAEARELLVLCGKLEQVERDQTVKQAQTRTSVVASASQYLDGVLGVQPMSSVQNESEVKEAASQLVNVDHLRDAAIVFADYMQQANS